MLLRNISHIKLIKTKFDSLRFYGIKHLNQLTFTIFTENGGILLGVYNIIIYRT